MSGKVVYDVGDSANRGRREGAADPFRDVVPNGISVAPDGVDRDFLRDDGEVGSELLAPVERPDTVSGR